MTEVYNFGPQGKRSLRDHVTPYKTALLVLIEEYCEVFEQPNMTEDEEREFLIGLLNLVQTADLEFKDLFAKLKIIAKPSLVEAVQERLMVLTRDGIGALMDLFQSLQDKLFREPDPLLHKSSVLGLFVRSVVLAFEKLPFSEVTQLYKKYCPINLALLDGQGENEAGDDGPLGESSLMMDIGGDCSGFAQDREDTEHHSDDGLLDTGRYSQRQAEYFIAKQSSLLQHCETEALPPQKLQQKIADLLTNNPDLAEAHYLSYLNNLRIHEYCAALDSLYHFFDRQQPGATVAPSSGNKMKPDEDSPTRGRRYAALNLAALHYRFGHRQEALAAVLEAIRIAQENNDHVCLQHALSWFERLGVQGNSNTAYLLDRLVTKATELNLAYLTSLGVQAFAKHNMLATAQPSSVFEFLVKSDIVNCQHSQSDLMCVSYGQKAALWQLYGRREMCSLSCQLMLHLNTSDLGVYHNGEPDCIALCHLARLHAEQGDYEIAFNILSSAKRRFPTSLQHSDIWMLYEQQLVLTRALHHGNWVAAERAILAMSAVDTLEAKYCQCLLHKEKGEACVASELVQELISEYKEHRDKYQEVPELYARLLLLQGELFCLAGKPTLATEPLLACLTLCREQHFSYLVAMATVHLAYVQFCMGMSSQALQLLEQVLFLILSHGSLLDRARARLLWTKCQVATAAKVSRDARQQALLTGVNTMDDVIASFKKVEAHHRTKDALCHQARMYHALGYTAKRNNCALEFKRLDQIHPTFHPASVNSL